MNRLQEIKEHVIKSILPRWDHVAEPYYATVCAFSFSYSVGRSIIDFSRKSNIEPDRSRVLIVGAAGGRDFHWLTGFRYTVDVLDLGRHIWMSSAYNSTYIGDACQPETWKQITEKYDLLVMCDILEHLPEDFAALRNARMVLKDSGYLFLSVPYSHDLETTHVRSYSTATLRRLLALAGYDPVWKSDRPGLLEAFPRLLNAFNYGLALAMPTTQMGGNLLHMLLKAEYAINQKTRNLYRIFGHSPQKGVTLAARPIRQDSLPDYVEMNKKMFIS